MLFRQIGVLLLATLLATRVLASGGATPGPRPDRRTRSSEALAAAAAKSTPRAFVRGNSIRLYFPQPEGNLVFKASWSGNPFHQPKRAYSTTRLQFDTTPRSVPSAGSHWREAVILDTRRWLDLARQAAETLLPLEPQAAIYLQFHSSESILYRDASQRLVACPVSAQPEGIRIVRRLNSQELTLAIARIVESKLRAAHGGESLFLYVDHSRREEPRFILLDFAEGRFTLLASPRLTGDDMEMPRLMSTFDILAAFTVESHGWAVLKNPVSSLGRFLNTGVQTLVGILQTRFARFAKPPPPVSNAPPMDLAAWEAYLDKITGRRAEMGALQLLIDGEKFFPAFEKRVIEAQTSICLLLCIFDRDDVAVSTADLLKARAEEVPVRIIYDRLSSQVTGFAMPETSMAEGFVAPLSIGSYLQRDSKVHVRPFLNTAFSAEHSKVLVIDRRIAFLGGMNIGREYRYEWHDLMFELQGAIVDSLQSDFDRSWAHAGALGDLAYLKAALTRRKPSEHSRQEQAASLRRLYTKTGVYEIRKAVLKSLARSQNQIYLENPYLYDSVVIGALAKARHRGVDVRVILPSENDLGGGRSSNLVVANYLLRNGVRVFIYPGMTHVKALWADGWVCLGSANFNKLSLRRNHEVNIATSDRAIADQVRNDLFTVDFGKSHELTSELESSWTDHLVQTLFDPL